MSKKQPKESQYVRVARLAYELTQGVYPLYTHKNSPKAFTQPQLAACVLLKSYLNLSYRNTEEWLLASDKVGLSGIRFERKEGSSNLGRDFATNKGYLHGFGNPPHYSIRSGQRLVQRTYILKNVNQSGRGRSPA